MLMDQKMDKKKLLLQLLIAEFAVKIIKMKIYLFIYLIIYIYFILFILSIKFKFHNFYINSKKR